MRTVSLCPFLSDITRPPRFVAVLIIVRLGAAATHIQCPFFDCSVMEDRIREQVNKAPNDSCDDSFQSPLGRCSTLSGCSFQPFFVSRRGVTRARLWGLLSEDCVCSIGYWLKRQGISGGA